MWIVKSLCWWWNIYPNPNYTRPTHAFNFVSSLQVIKWMNKNQYTYKRLLCELSLLTVSIRSMLRYGLLTDFSSSETEWVQYHFFSDTYSIYMKPLLCWSMVPDVCNEAWRVSFPLPSIQKRAWLCPKLKAAALCPRQSWLTRQCFCMKVEDR